MKIIRNGCVEVRVWLTDNHPPEYRVDVARLYVADDKNGSSRYLTKADVRDAIRGLYDAERFLSSQSGDTFFTRLMKR